MNKSELIAAVVEKTELSKKDAEKHLKLLWMLLQRNLKKARRFSL